LLHCKPLAVVNADILLLIALIFARSACLLIFLCCPLTSTAEIRREEVFEVFNTISFLFDTQEKPFSFEVVKYFMEKITERVLAKLQGELASLKAEALNPVSIRASQVCLCARF
jgi:hypothetical protein